MTAFAASWISHLAVGGVQAAAVGLLVLALVRLAPRSSATWRHALLALALVKFALPPMIPFPSGLFTVMTPVVRPPFGEMESALRGGELAIALLVAHVVGMLVMTGRVALGWRAWRRWIAASSRDQELSELARSLALESGWRGASPEVRIGASLPVPLAGGVRTPVILLPARFAGSAARERLELVLRHELEHITRRDPLWNLAGSLLRTLWWWHPVLALLLREMRRVREERCDDAVVSIAPERARDYAHALIDLVPRAASIAIPLPACGATGSLFERRLRRLLDDGAVRRPAIGRAARLAIALLALVTLPGFGLARLDVLRFPRHQGGAAVEGATPHAHDHRHIHGPAGQPPAASQH
ncbi:MAG: M56 family metallopeptidase [Thermoanaerobaculia bacterium]